MLRRIQTKEEAEKKKKRNQIIIGVILIGLMVLSSAGYAFIQDKDTSTKETYGKYTFNYINGLWQTSINDKTYGFQYLPKELENISVSGVFDLTTYFNKPLYFVNNNPSVQEILINIPEVLRYQEACLTNCTDFPKKNCTNDNIIVFKAEETSSIEPITKVEKNQNCVYISGDYLKGADAFLYKALGII